MDPVTHALTSIAIGRAGLGKTARTAMPALIVSGLAADVDWVTRLGGASAFLRGHHTATHSLVGTILLALAVAAIFYYAGRKWPKFAVAFLPILGICAVGAGVHLLLDLLNGDGVMLLWPFSTRWFAWDLTATVDACILFFLLAGLLLPDLLRLILEEIGSRSKQHKGQRGAVVALVLVALFVVGRAVAHRRAIELLGANVYRNESPLSVGAFPKGYNPMLWSGVVETDNALVNVDVPLTPGSVFYPQIADFHFKPAQTLALENAWNSPAAIEFLSYARFPMASVEPIGTGFQVRLRDMRFESESPGRRGVIAVIDLNALSLVVNSHFEFDSSFGQ